MKNYKGKFRSFGVTTIVAVYLLILVGGIVRATGSGMGCPDWPKCFGQWVPPTTEAELPANYKEKFKVAGKEIADFNVVHTWTEYINRLIGVLIGFFIFITFLLSLSFYSSQRSIPILSFATFLAVGFQGWLGSVVVSTNLQPVMITLHMLLAQVIVAVLIFVILKSYGEVLSLKPLPDKKKGLANKAVLVCIVLSVIQLILGTQVREEVDTVAKSLDMQQRSLWLEEVGTLFYVHRSFSILVVLAHAYFFYLLYEAKDALDSKLKNWSSLLFAILFIEILSGIGMAYFAIPKTLQPVHLLFGSLILGVQFILFLFINFEKLFKKQEKSELHPAY